MVFVVTRPSHARPIIQCSLLARRFKKIAKPIGRSLSMSLFYSLLYSVCLFCMHRAYAIFMSIFLLCCFIRLCRIYSSLSFDYFGVIIRLCIFSVCFIILYFIPLSLSHSLSLPSHLSLALSSSVSLSLCLSLSLSFRISPSPSIHSGVSLYVHCRCGPKEVLTQLTVYASFFILIMFLYSLELYLHTLHT